MSCEFIFIAFIIYYIIEEALEIRKWGMKYIGSVWNVLDMVVVIVSKIFEILYHLIFIFNITRGINIIDTFSTCCCFRYHWYALDLLFTLKWLLEINFRSFWPSPMNLRTLLTWDHSKI